MMEQRHRRERPQNAQERRHLPAHRSIEHLHFVRILSEFCQNFVKISSNFSKISIIFCIQYSIFQHFSKSTHFCKILQKILQNFAKFLRISENFAKFCKICQKMSKFLQIFQKSAKILQNFAEFLQNFTEMRRF